MMVVFLLVLALMLLVFLLLLLLLLLLLVVEVTEEVMKIDVVVMTMEDTGEEEVTTEEAMEAGMKIEEIETIQAATLILADAIEEIQTGDLLLKMILERPPQRRQRPDLSLNCYRER